MLRFSLLAFAGLMMCLPLSGQNALEDLIQDERVMQIMSVESVSAGLLTLCDKDAPNKTILCAGAGGYASTQILETEGIYLPPEEQTPENVRANMDATFGESLLNVRTIDSQVLILPKA